MDSANLAEIIEPTAATPTPPKPDFRRQAFIAYIHVMTSPGSPPVGSIEHRAVMLLRDYFPRARENAKNKKLRVAKQAVIRRLQKEYGSKILPDYVWKKTLSGIDKMSRMLNRDSVFEAALYGYAIEDALLIEVVERTLVLPEAHTAVTLQVHAVA